MPAGHTSVDVTYEKFLVARAFLLLLQPYIPDRQFVNLWKKNSGGVPNTSVWTRDVDAAAWWVAESETDTYLARSTATRSYGSHSRISKDRASGLAFTSADIDEVTAYRDKPSLSRNSMHSLEIVKSLPVEPIAVINTGGGLQPIFGIGPISFDGPSDKERARVLLNNIDTAIRAKVWADHSVVLDSTPDMARLVRMPGSLNCKGSQPVEVRFIPWPGTEMIA